MVSPLPSLINLDLKLALKSVEERLNRINATVNRSVEKRVLAVFHMSPLINLNGYTSRTQGLMKSLGATEWQVTAVTRPGYPKRKHLPEHFKHSKSIDNLGVRYTFLNGTSYGRTTQYRYFYGAAKVISKAAIRNQAALIQASSDFTTALPSLLAARELGIPFIYEMRGLWHETRATIEPDYFGSEGYHLNVAAETLAAKYADHVFVLCPELRDHIIKWGVSPSRITLLRNAVDAVEYKRVDDVQQLRAKLGLSGKPVVGFAGSLVKYEGIDDLIDALEIVAKAGHEFDFLVVGEGKQRFFLQEMVHAAGIGSRTTFTGPVPKSEMKSYLSLMDVTPLPRKPGGVCELVSPLKPYESFAMGAVVLASDVAPLKTVLMDGELGLLFRKGDVADFAEKLTLLLKDAELRRSYACKARSWVEHNATWDHAAEVMTTTYQRILAEKN